MNVSKKNYRNWERQLSVSRLELTFPPNETTFLIDGPTGHLELLTLAAKETSKGVAVICHPHPLHLGTMHNKVVTTLAKAFHELGLHTVRFNYRGVGKSEGQFGNSIGEIADLNAVIDWVNSVLEAPKLWLAGFSFGAFIAASGAVAHSCQQLYTVAPAVTNQPFSELPLINSPWEVVVSEKDEVIPPEKIYEWFQGHSLRQPNMKLHKIADASHFFHGKLIELRTLVHETVVGL